MFIIGEKINATRKSIAKAVKKKDAKYIQKIALSQVEAGADMLDVNGGIAGKEAEYLTWLVETVQEVTDVPLCLDSTDAEALAQAIPLCKKRPMINSVSDEKERIENILPLVKEHQTQVIALCMSESKQPKTAEDRLNIASSLVEKIKKEGILDEDIYVDLCVFPISTDSNYGIAFLEALEQFKESYDKINTVCGLSNISYGLPERKLLNRVFMVMSVYAGIDALIIDPCDENMIANLIAAETLIGKDEFCMNYIQAYREGKLDI